MLELKDYINAFDDLLMCMGVHKQTSLYSSHRGIFRNPISFLDASRKYVGLSLALHGFAATFEALVWKQSLLLIYPVASMARILQSALSEDDLLHGGYGQIERDIRFKDGVRVYTYLKKGFKQSDYYNVDIPENCIWFSSETVLPAGIGSDRETTHVMKLPALISLYRL